MNVDDSLGRFFVPKFHVPMLDSSYALLVLLIAHLLYIMISCPVFHHCNMAESGAIIIMR
jgi:hypothetical protein